MASDTGQRLSSQALPLPPPPPPTQQQGLTESLWEVGAEVTRCEHRAAVLTQALASQRLSPWRPGRHRHQQLQGNMECSQNATHRAKDVNSYWEGCWGICFSLGFLLYWPVRKILVCVQMAMTGKKGRVSTKRDEPLYHGTPASLENGSLCQLPRVCPLSIPTSAQEAGAGLPVQPRVKAEMLSQLSCPRMPRASLARVRGRLCPRLSPCQEVPSFPFWGHQTQSPEARALPELVWRAAWWAPGQG